MVSTQKEANKAIWNSDRYVIADWIEHGHCLMTMGQGNLEMAQELMWLIDIGQIDPLLVAEQLQQQNWDYTCTDDYSEKDDVEYYPLQDSWDMAVGCAMVLTKKIMAASPRNREWLHQGLALFYGLGNIDNVIGKSIFFVDDSHETWLSAWCKETPWVREVVAQWALDRGDECPRWAWLFEDGLGLAPSNDFIDTVVQEMDDKSMNEIMLNPMTALMAQHAPLFFTGITQSLQTYSGLYGGVPDDYRGHEVYCKARAETIKSMFPDAMPGYRGNAEPVEVSSTIPSMGKLFCEDEPSSAV